MRLPSGWQLLAIVVVLIVLFGWKSLPNMARSLGQSMRIFKSEVDQMKEPSAASRDTVKGEQAEGASGGLGDRARDAADDVKDQGAAIRDEFRDGLRGEDLPADDVRRDDPRA